MRKDLIKEFDADAWLAARPIYLAAEGALDAIAAPSSLLDLARLNGFKGEIGAVFATAEGVLVGLGAGDDPFALAAASEKLGEGDFCLADDAQTDIRQAAFAWLLGGYRFDRYKAGKPAQARLILPQGADIARPRLIFDAVALIRDLVNTPANDMTPAALEDEARRVAARFGASVSVTVGDDLLAKGFPLIHAVGKASVTAPRLIDLTWGRADAPKVTLVGKGVCFDTGGLDIKPSSNMILMKKDMGGAAHALGLAAMIMETGLDLRLRVLIPAVENAISGAAYRPGDVLKSRKGLTVEINNTDAEGRLVLADAIALASEEAPALLVTLATLTGAARVAVGPDLAPFFTDDEPLAADIIAAAAAVADPAWRLPLYAPYDAMLSSPIADLNNSPNNSFAGSILAALFLKRFVAAGVPWAHFDIFAWRPKAAPGRPVGGEAQAVRALLGVLEGRFGSRE